MQFFIKKNDVLLFKWDYKTGYFWCDYNNFWSILEKTYKIDSLEIQKTIKLIIEEHLIKNIISIDYRNGYYINKLNEQLIKINVSNFDGFNQINNQFVNNHIHPIKSILRHLLI